MRHLLYVFLASLIASCGSNTPAQTETTVTEDSASVVEDQVQEPEQRVLSDTNITFAWRANIYNSQIQDSINTIFIDTAFCQTACDEERAALGFVATFIGSECFWDGNTEEGNLKCKLNEWLDIGYQCSDKHLKFLRQWFRNDTACLNRLNGCPLIPYTATRQTSFDEIRLSVKGSTIKVWFRANGMDLQTNENWYWTQEDTFESEDGSLRLVRSRKLKEQHEKFAS